MWARPRIHLCIPLVARAAVAARSPLSICRPGVRNAFIGVPNDCLAASTKLTDTPQRLLRSIRQCWTAPPHPNPWVGNMQVTIKFPGVDVSFCRP